MDQVITDLIILRVKVTRDGKERELSSVSRFAVSPSAVQERGPPTHVIDVAMNYRDNLR